MHLAFIILAVVVLALVGLLVLIAISVRRQGRFATKLMGRIFGTRLGRVFAARASKHLLADEGSLTMENLQRTMASNPELIARMAEDQGLDPGQARAALAQFAKMDASRQRDLIGRAGSTAKAGASTPEQIAAAVGPVSGRGRSDGGRAAAKRKAASQARRQQAKQKRR